MYIEHEAENDLKTTPEFRSFVAKRLDKMMDKYVLALHVLVFSSELSSLI